jgi:hypothetical protein
MKTTILTIVAIVTALAAAGIVTGTSLAASAHVSVFGSGHQSIILANHLIGNTGKGAAGERKEFCNPTKP